MSDTLGARILDAAMEWAAVWARVKAHDADSFALEDEAHGQLCDLCARADAAERLAVAADAFDVFCAGLDVQDARNTLLSLMRNLGPLNKALAAWRAIKGEVAE